MSLHVSAAVLDYAKYLLRSPRFGRDRKPFRPKLVNSILKTRECLRKRGSIVDKEDKFGFGPGEVERRKEERRKENLGPLPGQPERRLFDRRAQGTTTGQLLVEVGRFAAENMVFRQKGNKAAARRARKHLSLIMKLAKQRRAEISTEARGLSKEPGAAEEPLDDDGDE